MTDSAPKISVEAQYIKDLSFENPNAPASLAGGKKPVIDLSLDLHVVRIAEEKDVFEVILTIESKATYEEQSLFVLELVYAGVFTVSNVTEEERKIILGVHCPALLFPFARSIIASTTQSGGLQPLMIDPIDFGALYHSKMMQDAKDAESEQKSS
jgi:preprotein translocase subunit SecB